MEVPEHGIHRMNQIQTGIDERAIQIENHQLHRTWIKPAVETRHEKSIQHSALGPWSFVAGRRSFELFLTGAPSLCLPILETQGGVFDSDFDFDSSARPATHDTRRTTHF